MTSEVEVEPFRLLVGRRRYHLGDRGDDVVLRRASDARIRIARRGEQQPEIGFGYAATTGIDDPVPESASVRYRGGQTHPRITVFVDADDNRPAHQRDSSRSVAVIVSRP